VGNFMGKIKEDLLLPLLNDMKKDILEFWKKALNFYKNNGHTVPDLCDICSKGEYGKYSKKTRLLFKFVSHQLDVYKKAGLCPEKEGFQCSAWCGDLTNAKILFLGLNPGFTPQTFTPRIMSDGSFSWLENDMLKKLKNKYNLLQNKQNNSLKINKKDDKWLNDFAWLNNIKDKPNCDDLEDYFQNNLLKEPYTFLSGNGKNLTVKIFKSGKDNNEIDVKLKKGGVPYWKGIQTVADKIINGSNSIKNMHVRDIMKNVMCVETIPFPSLGSGDLLHPLIIDYYRDRFKRILEFANKVSIIVLVGKEPKEIFDNKCCVCKREIAVIATKFFSTKNMRAGLLSDSEAANLNKIFIKSN
jgi:hypothetical protein